MKRIWKGAFVVSLVLAASVGIGRFAFRRASAEPEAKDTAIIERGDLETHVQEVGVIEPLRKVELKSKVAGQVTDVSVDVGSVVRAGDVLVRLDPRDARRDVALAESRHRVNLALWDQAKKKHGIVRAAHEKGGLPALDLVQAEGERGRLDAQLAVDASEQAILRDRLHYTELRAPIDGVVLLRHVQPGEMVTPGVAAMVDGKPLLVVAQVETLLVRTELNQLDIVRLAVGDPVEVKVDAIFDHTFRGEIHRLAAMAQKSERRKDSNLMVFPVDVRIDTKQPGGDALRPGMMADISVKLAARENVLRVPLEAIARDNEKTQLRRITKDGQESLVDVTLGAQNERYAEVLSGVSEGDRIRVRRVSR